MSLWEKVARSVQAWKNLREGGADWSCLGGAVLVELQRVGG